MALAATTATYEKYELLIFKAIHRAIHKWGGEFDEYLSDAHEVFMYACSTFDKKKGKFSTYLMFLLNHLLVERVRKELKRRERIPTVAMPKHLARPEQTTFSIPKGISKDAKLVVKLVLDMPHDIKLAMYQRGKAPTSFEGHIKAAKTINKCITEFLGDLGWSFKRIDRTFNEIRRSL